MENVRVKTTNNLSWVGDAFKEFWNWIKFIVRVGAINSVTEGYTGSW